MDIDQQLAPALTARKREHLYRSRRVLASAQGTRVQVDGKTFTGFSSNDYLGLANHPKVIEAMQAAASQYGVGSGASHLVNGHSVVHHALEEELAAFTGRPRALLFSTGYMANIGTVNALIGKGDAVFEDKLNHASLLDAGLLSGARFQRFLHNDVKSLEQRVQASDANRKLIVVDGVFSMDGDVARLPEMVDIAERHNAWLMIDDAHGFGCLGKNGGGCAEHFGLSEDKLPILMGTLGKAFGTFGAFVAGSEVLIETLIQEARSYIYTTAMPPAVAAATRASLKLLQEEHWRRDNLVQRIKQFRAGAENLGLQLMPSPTPIQPVVLGDEARTMAVAAHLEKNGFLVGAIRPPTVPRGSARLRITFSANHTERQVEDLLSALGDAVQANRGDSE
ncbi:8-amino-7-oxononanoate synthase [Maricurvus nonylphenolicus]|uniref:8-amino-7-oxononanoate synthase n=1 Tax=Maricurvus nonylphenolicus TaxID=1008307 RepID=UPI0036F24C51